jgi:hypothetical protein
MSLPLGSEFDVRDSGFGFNFFLVFFRGGVEDALVPDFGLRVWKFRFEVWEFGCEGLARRLLVFAPGGHGHTPEFSHGGLRGLRSLAILSVT